MNTKQDVEDFLASKSVAVVGVSRDSISMSVAAYRQLKTGGYQVLAVNPNAQTIEGDTAYATLSALPKKPDGAIFFTQPAQTLNALKEAKQLGIRHVWIQQGAESPEVIKYCQENELAAVTKQCIMMFAPPVASFHAFHRGIKRFFGGLPK